MQTHFYIREDYQLCLKVSSSHGWETEDYRQDTLPLLKRDKFCKAQFLKAE